MTATCRSCGADIQWASFGPGRKKMPVDDLPHPQGNVLLDGSQLADGTPVCKALSHHDARDHRERGGIQLYRSHFVTCPQADQHRQGDRA